jgi:hypothetical protein
MVGGVGSQTTTGTLSDPSHRFSQVASSGVCRPHFHELSLHRSPWSAAHHLRPPVQKGLRRWALALAPSRMLPQPRHRPTAGPQKKKKTPLPFLCAGVLAWHRTCCVLCGASWVVQGRTVYCIAYCERRGPAAGSRRSIRSSNCYIFLFFFLFLYF